MADRPTAPPTIEQLFERLARDDHLSADDASEAVAHAEALADADGEPWYLRVLSFGGAWLSAAFLALAIAGLGSLLGVSDAILEHWAPWLAAGILLVAAGMAADDAFGDTMFASHLAAVAGVAGLGSVVGGSFLLGEALIGDIFGPTADGWLPGAWLAGLAALCLGTAVRVHARRDDRRFFTHLAFAASAAGQALAISAAYLLWHELVPGDLHHYSFVASFVVEATLTAILYRLYDTDFHRFLTSLVVCGLAVAAIFDLNGDRTLALTGQLLLASLFAAETAVVAAVFSPSRWLPLSTRLNLRPLGYACGLSIAGLASELFLLELAAVDLLWPYRGAVAAALIYTLYGAVDASDISALEPAVWGAGATIALAVVSTPGVLVALLLLFLGIWQQRGWILALALFALAFHLIVFYYLMEITLFDKSLMLMATGAVLLIVRAWFRRRPWFENDSPS